MSLIPPLLSLVKAPIDKNDDSKYSHVRLEQLYADGSKKKFEVAFCLGNDIEKLLFTIREFREAMYTLQYDTGAELLGVLVVEIVVIITK
jgi:hypothetical protein